MTPTGTGTTTKRPAPIDPRIRQRRQEIQRRQGRRRLRWIVGVVVAAALVVAGLALLHTRWFSAQVVTVTGSHLHTSTSAIEAAAGLTGHPALISVDPGATAAHVESLPYIASAVVHRHWPDGVQIAVTERVPAVVMAGPGTSWSVLDGFGRTLQVAPARVPALIVLIVHTTSGGVAPSAIGGTLDAAARPGLVVCRTLPPAFVAQVVSVTVAPDATVSLALNSGLTVLLGTVADLHAKYVDVASIIAAGSLRGAKTIDVTVPQSPTVGR